MPRSTQEILDHADELAQRFEDANPDPDDVKDAAPLRAIRDAVIERATAEKAVDDAVVSARHAGVAWTAIAAYLGTSYQAAMKKHGGLIEV